MQNDVEAFGAVESMNSHHEAVLVFVAYLETANVLLRKPARVIRNGVAPGVSCERRKVLPSNNVRRALGNGVRLVRRGCYLGENLLPIWHRVLAPFRGS